MPTLNDFGDAAVARVEQQAQALAAKLGIQKEIIYGYFNDTAHFPQTLGELEQWGNKPTKYGISRRDPTTGAWTPIMPGVNPDPRLSAQDRGGFGHFIRNAEDSQIQRFQQVDPSGNVFGGSWDPAYNAQHPELAGRSGFQTAQTGLTQSAQQRGPTARTAQAGVPARGSADVRTTSSVAPGNPYTPGTTEYDVWNSANPGPDQAGTPTPTATPGATPAASSPGSTQYGIIPGQLDAANVAANNAAQIAYNNKRLELDRDIANQLDAREKQRIALEAARDAWTKEYQTAVLTGHTSDGRPILEAAKALGYIDNQATVERDRLTGEQTGYTGQSYATRAQQAFDALAPEQRTGAAAARIWQNIVPGLSADEAAAMNEAGHQYYAATGHVMPDAVAGEQLSRVTGGRVTGTGQMPTLAREQEQNRTAISALTLLSQLQGPENAFTYARTLANLPPEIRQNIQAAWERLPFTAQNPAQRGVLGDVGVGAPSGGGLGQPGGGGDVRILPIGGSEPTQAPPITPGLPGGVTPGGMEMFSPGIRPGDTPATNPALTYQRALPGATGPRTAQQSTMQYLPAPQAAGVAPPGGASAQLDAANQAYAAGAPRPAGTEPTQALLGGATRATAPMGAPATGGYFADASRGNPQPGMAYSQVITPMQPPGTSVNPVGTPDPRFLRPGFDAGRDPRTAMAQPPTTFGPRTQPAGGPTGAPDLPFRAGGLSPTAMLQANPYAQKVMWAGYRDAGGDIGAGQWEYQHSLPTATGPRTARYRAA